MGGVGKVKSGKREVVHSRARVCRSRRYRRLHRAGYSHRLAFARQGVTNGRRPKNLGYVKSATQNHFFCGGPDTFCVDDDNAPLLRHSLSLSSPAYYSRGAERAAERMPTHRISRERGVQSVHGLIESQAHYFLLPLTPSPIPFALPSLPLSGRRTDCVGLPVM